MVDLNQALWFFTYYVIGSPFRDALEVMIAYTPKFMPEFWDWLTWNMNRVHIFIQ